MNLPKPRDIFAGRFQIVRKIGSGGFATVFEAFDQSAAQTVALKILHPDEAGVYDPQTHARFRREVDLVRGLRSPHTVQFCDHGFDDGMLWAAFELVPGEDLSVVLAKHGTLDAATTKHILSQVLESLKEAHACGLVHRDLKPENIRVFPGPLGPFTVKVLDFGIARSTDHGHPSLTKTGELVGTPRYMSPEQLRGTPVTAASDIYTVGLIGIELLAGRGVLGSNSVLDQVERALPGYRFEVKNPNPEVQRLADALRRMLAPEPQDRLGTAHAALHAIHERPVAARGSTGPERPPVTSDEPRRGLRPWMLIVPAVVLVALVALWGSSDDTPVSTPLPQTRENPMARLDPTPVTVTESEEHEDTEAVEVPALGIDHPELPLPDGAYRSLYYVPKSLDRSANPAILLIFADRYFSPNHPVTSEYIDYLGFHDLSEKLNVVLLTALDEARPSEVIRAVNGLKRLYELPEDAPLLLFGERGGAGAAEKFVAEQDYAVAALVTSAVLYQPDRPLYRAERVPRLDFTQTKDWHTSFDGEVPRRDRELIELFAQSTWPKPTLPAPVRHGLLRENHECGKRIDARTLRHGACQRWECAQELEICIVEGGQWWKKDVPWVDAERRKEGGEAVDFPYTRLTAEFFARQLDRSE